MMNNNAQHKDEIVILLHGILMPNAVMHPLRNRLRDNGFMTCNIDYPSTKMTIEQAREYIHDKIQRDTDYPKAQTMHFVTHSLGSLIARDYINTHHPEKLGKVVMMGPPNQGSDLADYLDDHQVLGPIYRTLFGPAGAQLRTTARTEQEEINYPLGIIAGCASINPLSLLGLKNYAAGEHDGTVPIKRTMLDGMTDHIVMETSHTSMVYNNDVTKEIVHFLENGRFEQSQQPAPSAEPDFEP